MSKSCSSQSGVALLMTLGILALLSILGAAFSTNMRLMERTTRDFVYEIQARYLAEGGIEYAIASLKDDARDNFIYNSNVAIPDQTGLLPDGSGSIKDITIIDTASLVNINNATKKLLGCLTGISYNSSNDTGLAKSIKDKRDILPGGRFLTKQSICLTDGIGKDTYSELKDSITIYSYADPNVQDEFGNVVGSSDARSAININTVQNTGDKPLLKEILKVVSGVGDSYASTVAAALINNRPIQSCAQFGTIIDNLGISSTAKENIKNVFNPNRTKPDANYPTEFCFHSGGTYEIAATGEIIKGSQTLAQKTITSTIRIFDLWNQTTGEQFKQPDYLEDGSDGKADGEIFRINWMDSCPVNSNDKWINPTIIPSEKTGYNNSTEYYTIGDSLKIGYWDNFSEDIQFSNFEWNDLKSGIESSTFNGYIKMPEWGEVILNTSNKWLFGNSSVIVWEYDEVDLNTKRGVENEGWLWCDKTGWFMYRFYNNMDEYYFQSIDWWKEAGEDYIDQIEYQVYAPEKTVVYADSDPYIREKAYRVLQPSLNALTLYIDESQPIDGVFERIFPISIGNRHNGSGYIKFWAKGSCRLDNLRIIPDTGYYISIPYTLSEFAEYGILWGTVTIPESADDDDVEIRFQISTDGGISWSSESELSGDNADGIPILLTGQSIQYKANFYSKYSDKNQYSETPVLEDVWITYLPKTKILYWREGAEE